MIGFIKSIFFMVLFFFFFKVVNFIGKMFFILYSKNKKQDDSGNKNHDVAFKMVQCSKCKIYISQTEAYKKNGEFLCKKDYDEK
jgi:hypothetical protein